MNKTILLTAIFFGGLAIVFGAFAAHGLEKLLDDNALRTFETGVRYQMYHALFLLVLGITQQLDQRDKKWVYYTISSGVVLFSFSIYLLATNSLTSIDFKQIAFLTPMGGVLLILGWGLLAYRVFKRFN